IIVSKELLTTRVREKISEERRLVGKIISQVKSAKKNPQTRLNIDEPQLQAHLQEEMKK
ncbi:5623_t:CDS:1, partial [Cetraspora pellucida]